MKFTFLYFTVLLIFPFQFVSAMNISGEYSNEYGNAVVNKINNDTIEFKILIQKGGESGCVGEFEKQLVTLKGNKAIVDQEDCKIELVFSKNKLEILEEDCSMYYGMNCFFDGVYTKSAIDSSKAEKKKVDDGLEGELLPPAPINSYASERVGMAMLQIMNLEEEFGDDPAQIREFLVKSYEACGYSFYKTVREVAENPLFAQSNGMWTGSILSFTSEISDEELGIYFSEKEAEAILALRKFMQMFPE